MVAGRVFQKLYNVTIISDTPIRAFSFAACFILTRIQSICITSLVATRKASEKGERERMRERLARRFTSGRFQKQQQGFARLGAGYTSNSGQRQGRNARIS